MLVDHEIATRQASAQPLATDVPADDYSTAKSKIQAAAVNLTIGDIYIPGREKDKPGGADTPLGEIALKQGHTAVIRTKEVLKLGSDLAGIAFPRASKSLKGLLMTNPGHIDPGYSGPLHLTVINMSREPHSLRRGDEIVRVLLIALRMRPEVSFDVRWPGTFATPITSELLDNLSVDFVDVENRAREIANGAVKKAKIWATGIPVVVALVSLAGVYFSSNLTVGRDIQKVSERVTIIETKLSQQALSERLKKLEDEVAKLRPAPPTTP